MTSFSRKLQLLKSLEELELLEQEYAEKSLASFAQRAWEVLEPGKPLLWNWHHDAICEYLTAVRRGEVKRLIINIPPRYMKSILVSVCFPAWVWVEDARKRFLCTSYAQTLSTKHSVDRRMLIESAWYQRAWGHRFGLSSDQNVKTEFSNDKRGHMIATSMSGSATGKGGDYLLVDDPHDTTIAESDIQREQTVEDFRLKFSSRLDDKKKGAMIIVMQRLHEKDLTGEMLREGGWEHLKVQGQAEKKTVIVFPLSKRKVVREPGDILHEEREGLAELTAQKKAMGSYGYAGQYQQEPSAREGGIIKRKWFKFYKTLPERWDRQLQSWDCSFKDAEDSDYVVGGALGKREGNIYLLDLVREQLDLPGTISAIKTFSLKHPRAWEKLIEDKANGTGVIQTLKGKVPGIITVEPLGSKDARLSAASVLIEAGNFFLPDPDFFPLATWVEDFIKELITFPKGAFDDQCDMISQALLRFMDKGSDTTRKLIRW